jgi:Cof subfamily protein (haloacid dehalogenase superfamily)
MGKLKLICTDIDGTLVKDDHISIPEQNIHALLEAQRNGVKVALVSGRGVFSQKRFVKGLFLDQYDGFLIAFTGAKIVTARHLEMLFGLPLAMTDVRLIFDHVSPLGMDIMIYDDEEGIMYATSDNEFTRFDQQVTGMAFKLLGSMELTPRFTTYKCIIAGSPLQLDKYLNGIKQEFSQDYSITRSSSVFAEFNLKAATKGNAVRQLARRLNISSEEVLAVGNGENDESMLSIAGMSATPADAMEEAKRSAKFLCERRNADGALAEAIEHYLKF